jgi:hypothetical protein
MTSGIEVARPAASSASGAPPALALALDRALSPPLVAAVPSGARKSRASAPPSDALVLLVGAHLSKPAVRDLVRKVPGVGPLYERAIAGTKQFAPGFAVWAPKLGAFMLLSASSEAIRLGKGGPRFGYATMVDPAGKHVQLGVGRVDPLGLKPDGQFYFWNVRVSPDGMARALAESSAKPGREVVVGSGVVGLAGVPQCRYGPAHASLTTALGAGVGLRATVVARGGEVYFKVGALSVPEPLMQGAISAAAKMLSAKDALVCRDGRALRAQVAEVARAAAVSAGNRALFTAEQLTSALQLAAAIASAIAGAAAMQPGELR